MTLEETPMETTEASIEQMRNLVLEMARVLVDNPNAVTVERIAEAGSFLFRLRVAPEDVGKVIGKQGRTARSLRTILSAASMKMQTRLTLDIVDDQRASE